MRLCCLPKIDGKVRPYKDYHKAEAKQDSNAPPTDPQIRPLSQLLGAHVLWKRLIVVRLERHKLLELADGVTDCCLGRL